MGIRQVEIEVLNQIRVNFAAALAAGTFDEQSFKGESNSLAVSIATKLTALEVVYLIDRLEFRKDK